jgi:hypothetical protein
MFFVHQVAADLAEDGETACEDDLSNATPLRGFQDGSRAPKSYRLLLRGVVVRAQVMYVGSKMEDRVDSLEGGRKTCRVADVRSQRGDAKFRREISTADRQYVHSIGKELTHENASKKASRPGYRDALLLRHLAAAGARNSEISSR